MFKNKIQFGIISSVSTNSCTGWRNENVCDRRWRNDVYRPTNDAFPSSCVCRAGDPVCACNHCCCCCVVVCLRFVVYDRRYLKIVYTPYYPLVPLFDSVQHHQVLILHLINIFYVYYYCCNRLNKYSTNPLNLRFFVYIHNFYLAFCIRPCI